MEKRSLAQLFDLTGKAAIVTGGAMGIGQAIALRLSEAGAAVTIADINLEAAQQTVEQIVSTGGKATALQASSIRTNWRTRRYRQSSPFPGERCSRLYDRKSRGC